MHVLTETTPADLLSHSSTTNKLKSSIWQHGSEWLSTQNYPEQTHIYVATNELLVEINPVNPVPPVLLTEDNLPKILRETLCTVLRVL